MITLDENGQQIDFLAKRNEEIKDRLSDTLKEFLAEKTILLNSKKGANLGYRFAKQIYTVLSSYGMMTAENVSMLDYETINDYWLKYLDLTAYYNKYFEIVDNKQLFMAFMGVNSRQFAQLEKSQDEDIANLMLMINNAFIGLGFVAGESGNANPQAVKQRLGASGAEGHNIISATEEKITDALGGRKTSHELDRELALILGQNTKLIG